MCTVVGTDDWHGLTSSPSGKAVHDVVVDDVEDDSSEHDTLYSSVVEAVSVVTSEHLKTHRGQRRRRVVHPIPNVPLLRNCISGCCLQRPLRSYGNGCNDDCLDLDGMVIFTCVLQNDGILCYVVS